ncbi:FtsQ-type POTRA domain-containing protein, partial [Escherichia coli]|nr:FtsQ-type POTRA domain-containing protein [Escherichia coli]
MQELKQKIEKVPFVKSAAVARRLPAGIVVSISERVPVARVRIGNGDFLVDNDGEILAPAETGDTQFPVLLLGWDQEKSER